MNNFTKEELKKAETVLTSLLNKCEKAKVNLIKGQLTLIEDRISSLKIATALIANEIEALDN